MKVVKVMNYVCRWCGKELDEGEFYPSTIRSLQINKFYVKMAYCRVCMSKSKKYWEEKSIDRTREKWRIRKRRQRERERKDLDDN